MPPPQNHPISPLPTPSSAASKGVDTGNLKLECPVVGSDGMLPVEFTGDGAGISPPLSWTGAPQGTKAYAIIMHHIDPEGKIKWYWTLYNIPHTTASLPKNVKGVGIFGSNSVNRQIGYAPPHSKGPGPKTYVITLYALSQPLEIKLPPEQVNRDILLEAMKEKVLTSSEIRVVYSRSGTGDPNRQGPPPPPVDRDHSSSDSKRPDNWIKDLIPSS